VNWLLVACFLMLDSGYLIFSTGSMRLDYTVGRGFWLLATGSKRLAG